MKAAYRIPLGKFPIVARFTSQETEVNTPITEMVVNSLITEPGGRRKREAGDRSPSAASPGTAATASAPSRCRSTAARAGATRRSGRISAASPSAPGAIACAEGAGKHTVMARATNAIGETQATADLQSGRLPHNVVRATLIVALGRDAMASLIIRRRRRRARASGALPRRHRSSSRRPRAATRSRATAAAATASTISGSMRRS